MRRIGVRLHGVTLNVTCDFESLREYVIEEITAAEHFDPAQIERDLGMEGIRLCRYGTDDIACQAPASFAAWTL
jgi:hypothetical protein